MMVGKEIDCSTIFWLSLGVTVQFSPTAYTVTEGGDTELILVLTGDTAVPITVDLATMDGSAQGRQRMLLKFQLYSSLHIGVKRLQRMTPRFGQNAWL